MIVSKSRVVVASPSLGYASEVGLAEVNSGL